MPYWRMYFHLIWTTRNREPLLVDTTAQTVEASIRSICEEMKVLIHALFLMPDHAHLAVSIPPSLTVASVVSRLKGFSSHLINHSGFPQEHPFAWQSEYGVVTFGEKNLSDVVEYIETQQTRHASQYLINRVERISE